MINKTCTFPRYRYFAIAFAVVAIFAFPEFAAGQQTDPDRFLPPTNDTRKNDMPKSMQDMLAKQQAEKLKKNHEEMLKRGDEALKLSADLEKSFEAKSAFAPTDVEKLQALEKVVSRIRKDLGGDSDEDKEDDTETQQTPPNTRDAVTFLRSTTVKLVDELKKTSRFTISAIAIQSTNNVIRLARFLRLRK